MIQTNTAKKPIDPRYIGQENMRTLCILDDILQSLLELDVNIIIINDNNE